MRICLQADGFLTGFANSEQGWHPPGFSSSDGSSSSSSSSNNGELTEQRQSAQAMSAQGRVLSGCIKSVMPANASAEEVAGIWESVQEWRSVDRLLPILPVSNAAAFSQQQATLLQQGACQPQEPFTADWPPSTPEPPTCMAPCDPCSSHGSCHGAAEGSCGAPSVQSHCPVNSSRGFCCADTESGERGMYSRHPAHAAKRSLHWLIWPVQGCNRLLQPLVQPCLVQLRPVWLMLLDWLGWSLLSCARVTSLAEPAWIRYFSWLLESELGPSFRCVQVQQQVAASQQDLALEQLWAMVNQPGPVNTCF